MTIKEMMMSDIEERMAAIKTEMENRDADLDALTEEVRQLKERRAELEAQAEKRRKLEDDVRENGVTTRNLKDLGGENEAEARAKQFAETGKTNVKSEEVRSVLVSGGKLATPTQVSGINDSVGKKVSSIIDLVKIVNCTGMGSNKVAYIDTDAAAADGQTEGESATSKEPTFGFVTITPDSVAVLSYISKQAKKQTPLAYQQKVHEQALTSLRKKAAILVTTALKESDLNESVAATVTGGKGVIDEKTLRKITLAYGGDESVVGGAVLFLNKLDLIAFGDVRGTNEKKAVYEIEPDTDNPNTGIIKDGGLSVRYCINSNLTACAGTAQSASDTLTMFYGNPQCFELDLFSDYEIRTSEDFAFDKLMDTIRGDVEIGGDVVVKNGFVALKLPKSGS